MHPLRPVLSEYTELIYPRRKFPKDPDDMLLVVYGVIVACLIQLLGHYAETAGKSCTLTREALILDTTYQASPKETTPRSPAE